MSWDELSEEEKQMWDNHAKEHPKYWILMRFIANKQCFQCKFKPQNMGEYLFHFKSTHGIRDLIEFVNELDKK